MRRAGPTLPVSGNKDMFCSVINMYHVPLVKHFIDKVHIKIEGLTPGPNHNHIYQTKPWHQEEEPLEHGQTKDTYTKARIQ